MCSTTMMSPPRTKYMLMSGGTPGVGSIGPDGAMMNMPIEVRQVMSGPPDEFL